MADERGVAGPRRHRARGRRSSSNGRKRRRPGHRASEPTLSETAAGARSAVGAAVDTVSMIALAIVCAMSFLWDVVLVRVMVTLNMNDFGKFYYSARAFLAGRDMYTPSPATQLGAGLLPGAQQLLNLNPPHFHLLVIPLAGFQPSLAVLLWMLANTLTLVLSVLIAAAELEVVATG